MHHLASGVLGVLFVWLVGWFSTWGQWIELRPSHLDADVAIIRYLILGSSHTCPDIIVKLCVCVWGVVWELL